MPFLEFYIDHLIQICPFNNNYKLGQCESCEKLYLYKTNEKAVIQIKTTESCTSRCK